MSQPTPSVGASTVTVSERQARSMPGRRPFIGPLPPPLTGMDALFGRAWPDRRTPGRPRLVVAAAVVAASAALILPGSEPGAGLLLILLGASGVVASALLPMANRKTMAALVLAALLLTPIVLRDAGWVVALCLLAAFVVAAGALVQSQSVTGMVVGALAVPMAWLRGLPWLRRCFATLPNSARAWSLVRTAVISLGLLMIFGALFSSADALFAQWMRAVLPQLSLDDLPFRVAIFVLVAAATLAGVFVALAPPAVQRLTPRRPRPVGRWEWAVPVAAVAGLFVTFLAAQLTALFGGHDYLRRTTGLTYAEYVHQGFGQMTVAAAIVLLLVAVVARRAPRRLAADRLLLRILLGGLCLLTLVIIASALYRIQVYEQAYGFTRLRLLVTAFELWLGIVLLLVATAGVRLRGIWVPKAAVFVGAVMLLGLAWANPDSMIAERNLERFSTTGDIDWRYLQELSADAVPTLSTLPEPYRSCVLSQFRVGRQTWVDWNLGRQRADAVVITQPAGDTSGCYSLRSR
ncbi:DUF4173 domain-containing protein [Microlunatus panaciterrae]|uniref:DUF4173 domain-containing protein n=1 Tax=Microlunatus panaciterrae TaxID=400768 RepID=A0ABS2RI00_9ACTN|nr:DUF4173 domain-containing protein [Microlunatus panaciterrae]MBM7798615.1 hypothetical protein [Microlunatus panaciterrae]